MKTLSKNKRLKAKVLCAATAGITILAGGCTSQEAMKQALIPPPGALAAGYTRLAFDEEFNDTAGIDLDDTRKPGFNFYPRLAWGDYTLSKKHIQVKDGVLHLYNPTNCAQADLFSAVNVGNGKYNGFVAGGGAYFEASISFDPLYKKKNPGTDGFPAFWSNSYCWLVGARGDPIFCQEVKLLP